MTATPQQRADTARTAARRAASSILDRRQDYNPDAMLPDDDDLYAVARYGLSDQRFPAEVLQSDALDIVRIMAWLGIEIDQIRRSAISMARAQGATWRQIAGPLGVTSAPGAKQYADRLEEAAAGGPRCEKAARARRAGRTRLARQPTDRADRVRRVGAELVKVAAAVPDDAVGEDAGVDLDMLAEDLAAVPPGAMPSPGMLGQLRLILRALDTGAR